jgi:hypothetical protein
MRQLNLYGVVKLPTTPFLASEARLYAYYVTADAKSR